MEKEFKPILVFEVLPKIMNSMVVNVSKHKLHASVKALEGYIAFHRLIIYFVQFYPELLEHANTIVRNFIAAGDNRTKQKVPDLGVFLTYLAITDYQWSDIAKKYMAESFTRHVRWIIQKYPELAKETPDPEIDKNRNAKTLLATVVSQRLLLFQLYFLKHIGRPPGKSLDTIAKEYDATFGRPTNEMKQKFLDGVRQIAAVNTWESVFEWVGLECPAPEALATYLRECIPESLRREYHYKPKNFRTHTHNTRDPHRRPPPRNFAKSTNTCKFFRESRYCPHGNSCRYSHVI